MSFSASALTPGFAASVLPSSGVLYVECPDFASQMEPGWEKAIPKGWTCLQPEELTPEILEDSRLLFYRPALGLFPSFWTPLWARFKLAVRNLVKQAAPAAPSKEVWIPVPQAGLLFSELESAFREVGYFVRPLPVEMCEQAILDLLDTATPDLFFSVNFHGLDPEGQVAALLDQCGARTVVWCVDNPYNLISQLKAPYWRRIHLCVTDDWFIPSLEEMGAGHVLHFPLAASPEHMSTAHLSDQYDLNDQLLFVGRSEFPHKRKFFAGIQLEQNHWQAAGDRLSKGLRPDFSWWLDRLDTPQLWPGKDIRKPAYGAEESSRALRTWCLEEAATQIPVTVHGDQGWRELLPEETTIRPKVDYYGPLPSLYRNALANLNVTSLLLPHGLTQRHFDVWTAGGALITDKTPGLSIFPEDLVKEISFEHHSLIPSLVDRLRNNPDLRMDLIHEWRGHILGNHTYVRRLTTLLDALAEWKDKAAIS